MDLKFIIYLHISVIFSLSYGASVSNNYGYLKPCDKSLSEFQIKWTPKELKYHEDVTLSGFIVPNLDTDHIKACLNVTVDGIAGPLYQGCTDRLDCKKIKRYLPSWCPFRKGVRLVAPEVTKEFFIDIHDHKIYPTPGTYHAEVKFFDKKTGSQLLCGEGDITIAGDYEDYYYDHYYYYF